MRSDGHCILLITSSFPGVSKGPVSFPGAFLRDFAHELVDRGKQPVVLTQKTDQGPDGLEKSAVKILRFRWRGNEIPLSSLHFPRDILLISSVLFRGFLASVALARSRKIDLVLACWAIPSGLWALFLKWFCGIEYAVWCLGSDIWDYREGAVSRGLLRLILRQARTRYADGYTLKEDVESISGRPCHFMSTSRRLPLRRAGKADIIPGKASYLFVGRYHPNKGPDVLLEAIAALAPEIRQGVHFYFFGVGPLRDKLERMIEGRKMADAVTLHGAIDEAKIVEYLRECRALIIPSRIESIPVILSDALQVGCRLIVTDVGDMGKLVRSHKAGIVVPPESPMKMAEAIERDFFENGDFSRGRKELLALFDLSTNVEEFLARHFGR